MMENKGVSEAGPGCGARLWLMPPRSLMRSGVPQVQAPQQISTVSVDNTVGKRCAVWSHWRVSWGGFRLLKK
jgi:hypothetical protein